MDYTLLAFSVVIILSSVILWNLFQLRRAIERLTESRKHRLRSDSDENTDTRAMPRNHTATETPVVEEMDRVVHVEKSVPSEEGSVETPTKEPVVSKEPSNAELPVNDFKLERMDFGGVIPKDRKRS